MSYFTISVDGSSAVAGPQLSALIADIRSIRYTGRSRKAYVVVGRTVVCVKLPNGRK